LEPDMPRHRRILDSIVGSTGQPLDPDRVYTVVTNDFLANGGDGFTMFKKALSRKEVAPDIKAFFRQALRQAGTIDYVSDRRWSVGKIRY
jgi:5'-nucleotidase / UDP-sugar diphosphatase